MHVLGEILLWSLAVIGVGMLALAAYGFWLEANNQLTPRYPCPAAPAAIERIEVPAEEALSPQEYDEATRHLHTLEEEATRRLRQVWGRS